MAFPLALVAIAAQLLSSQQKKADERRQLREQLLMDRASRLGGNTDMARAKSGLHSIDQEPVPYGAALSLLGHDDSGPSTAAQRGAVDNLPDAGSTDLGSSRYESPNFALDSGYHATRTPGLFDEYNSEYSLDPRRYSLR